MEEAFVRWRPEIDDAIEEWIPRQIDDEYLADLFGAPSYEYDTDAVHYAISEPVWSLLDTGGKRWRPILFLTMVEALGYDPEEFLQYACIPEILHSGTVIVDDIEDGGKMRRGEQALHLRRGYDVALNAGNALYFFPLKIISQNDDELSPEQRLRIYEILEHEFNRTHLGQGMDIQWHNEQEIGVNEQEYYEMCACKTGSLVRILSRLAIIVAGEPEEYETHLASYAENLSISFQIMDDVLDVTSSEQKEDAGFGKEFGNDIKEGKKTLMIIYAAEQADQATVRRLEEILWAEENTDEEIREVLELLQETGAVDYARQQAKTFSADARAALDNIDLEDEPEQRLKEFTTFVIERET